MSKRMLIDDTHAEETRVVVVNGNKIEDVEFETSSRKQIKGNVYLAKIMRVEPSLQAAFVDYGGNRHGFLAFGEIHPDYYNISEQKMAELEKEVETTIENKKQLLKDREAERNRVREEKALKRTQKMEQETLEKTQEPQVLEETKSEDAPQNQETDNQAQENVAAEASAEEKKEIIKKNRTRRSRRPRQKIENKEVEGKEEVKTLAEAAGCKEDRICEDNTKDNDLSENNCKDAYSINDDDVAGDDDDDNEYDFEVQKKLVLMRKLFHQSRIQDVIKEGQILLVQIAKEERGNKGAALTTYLSLAGRYCVLMPNRIKSGGVSRKITNAQDRKRLKSIIKELPISSDMSLIVRTAGEEKTRSDIVRDYNYLIRTWNEIRIESLKSSAPSLVYEEGNLIKRALRDMFTKEVSEIIVDGNNAYQAAKNFLKILSPHSLKKLKSCRATDIPLFQRFQVESQLDKLHDINVQLESGGYLVINPTEALVSIDVNSGRATKEKDLEETALKTNLEAADEIAKQLRMRNLAGLVVIDFIDMEENKNNLAVEKRMKEAMKKDRARVQIGKMSCFGLLEISRQRMHSSFFESSYQTCPYCHGRGIIRTIESGSMAILRAIEEEGIKGRSSRVSVVVTDDVAIYLLNQKRTALCEMEQRYSMSIIICADREIKNIADFRIERTKQPKPSEEAAANEVKNAEANKKEVLDDNLNQEVVEKVEEDLRNEIEPQIDTGAPQKEEGEERYNNRNRGGRYDRRQRFDRRRNNRDRRDGNQELLPQRIKEEAVVLYNSHEQPSTDGDKRKVTWWKKLIKG